MLRDRKGISIRLSTFIVDEMDQILACWDAYARTMTPAADGMSLAALRNHSEAMLRAVALDIDSPQTRNEQRDKSQGLATGDASGTAASEHGYFRQASNYTLLQLSAEFRALRASVLRLWLQRIERVTPIVLDDVIRFNEAIDQAVAESIVTYSAQATHSRDMFDAILGHDLRGPLSAMSLAGELLQKQDMPAAGVAALGVRVRSSALYMSSMVDDMLEFARIRLGQTRIPVHPQLADLESICSGAIADAASVHPGSRFELQMEGPREAWVDPNRMRQLLMNLLGNAGQHGARDRPVRLLVKVDELQTLFRVVNEGADIPSHLLHTIFEPLVRLQAEAESPTHRTTSLGLGLHIAREIAVSHGGSIDVRSEAQVTTFSVHIPANATAPVAGGTVQG
jgi:signal transduction histidine kinase